MRKDENKISAEGRGPLNFGEREALAQQHRNRDQSRGTAAEVVQRQAAQPVDTALKTPVFTKYGG
jgi:hypothetical protein